MTRQTEMFDHMRVELAIHTLRSGSGVPLLLLHGLGEQTPANAPQYCESWPGPICGLDFTGHGSSTVPPGGGYTSEALMSDADAALGRIGPATVLGRGLGAYVALQLAGARPNLVRGAVLADGPGLFGGASGPTTPFVVSPGGLETGTAPDPFALLELSREIRPTDYAMTFLGQALQLSGLDSPITVAAVGRPDWLAAVAADPAVRFEPLETALELYQS